MTILLLLVGLAVLPSEVVPAEMSANDVIKKSEAAYAAAKTYVGTTTVQIKTDRGDKKSEAFSIAKVTFMRPGKVCIEGKTASRDASGKGGQPFAIVSDGKTTWKSFGIQNNGAFSQVQNLQMAGAATLSLGVADGILAALMKSDGASMGSQDPFNVPRLAGAALAGHETIDGADCYKLVAKHASLGDVTVWIDSKSFLLRQMTREMSDRQMAAAEKLTEETFKKIGKERPARPSNAPAAKSLSTVFSFMIDKVDGPVDQKLFADPTKK